MALLSYTTDTINEQLLYIDYHNDYYHQMMQSILSLILPFYVILLAMDHDQPYHKPLMSYFSRSKIIISKFILYITIVTWVYFVTAILYFLLPSLLTKYFILDLKHIIFFLDIYMDGLILLCLSFILIKDRFKSLSVAIPLFYVLVSFVIEDYQQIAFYYLFPIYSKHFSSFILAYYYKLCYICLGFTIAYQKMLNEEQ
ncbi:MAG: hypothetical protein NUK62_02510 [Tenericutes bacterium]|nr:hypothetical protein [Mycoplasmatota bacterium]